MIAKIFISSKTFGETCQYLCQNQTRAEILYAEGVRSHDLKLMAADFEWQHRLMPEKEKPVFGGRLLPDGKTWVIPDEIEDINPFMQWLPHEEGYIVQKPYFSVRSKCLCEGISAVMQANYPFFQQQYSAELENKVWGNCCVHCQALPEEDGEYAYGLGNPLSPVTIEAAMEIKVIFFKMEFDYYISAGSSWCDLYLDIMP
jgi:hypothetical protein